jgi:23S rRNA (cytidine1920-2'-O)/16S rRNA (cytidine1409-2'-O)-methyltransferase
MKARLDILVVERGLAPTREKARGMIMAGEVTVDGRVVDKPGHAIPVDASLALADDRERFVGRGGTKLAGALEEFGFDPAGMTALDVGASTGGFTDCLLRRGAARVHAVDVGHGQLDVNLRNDARVVVMEKTNIRSLSPEAIPGGVDLAVIDTSFISLKTVLPHAAAFVRPGGTIIALVKPQFELGRGEVGKGVVRDEELRARAVESVTAAAGAMGLAVDGVCRSPITGAKGNVEFFVRLGVPREAPPGGAAGEGGAP